jgi:hypothetical protein
MYIALATTPDNRHQGSTKLHMDLTDAYNINLWATSTQTNDLGYALWHLFLASDAPLLRKFLIEECGFTGSGDPIHAQYIYLTPDLLQRLFKKYGVLPYTIHQYPGEAVLIPAYCAHQVANVADAIKIACDFFSMSNLRRTERLVGELRQQRLSDSQGDDVLQFYLTLWYTWSSLSRLAKICSRDVTSPDSFRELDILADSSVYPDSTPLVSIPLDDPLQMSGDPPNNSDFGDYATSTGMDVSNREQRKRERAKEQKKARRHARPYGASFTNNL